MEQADLERMKELVQKIGDNHLCVDCALTVEERYEMSRLLDKRIGEIEFGYPICGE